MKSLTEQPFISVVIPVYQAESCLHALYERLTEALSKLTSHYEIVLVDDASPDHSWAGIYQLASQDRKVKGIHLSRNFGQHYAVSAGLEHAGGDWVVIMDCDLQDPPEAIETLYQKAQEGYDVVYTYRLHCRHSFWKRCASKLYYTMINLFMKTKTNYDLGTLTLFSNKVLGSFLQMKEYHRHYDFLLRWVGYRQTYVGVEHHQRYAGDSSYSFMKLLTLAIDGIVSQTDLLLRWTIVLGFLSALTALGYFIYVINIRLHAPDVPLGWASIMTAVLFIGGAILTSIGVLGIYVDKIFMQTKQRPLYIIDESINL